MQRQLEKIASRIRNVLAIGRIHSVDDDYYAQSTFLSDETQDKTYVAQHYGFSSRPLKDSQCYGVCPGNREGMIIFATDDRRYRPQLKKGEAILYTDEGDSIHLKRGNQVEIKTKSLKIIHKTLDHNLLEVLGDVVEALEQAVVPTMMGPQSLSTRLLLAEAKEKFRSFTHA